jgi:hypothetical protein
MNGKRHDYGMFKEEIPSLSVVFPGEYGIVDGFGIYRIGNIILSSNINDFNI